MSPANSSGTIWIFRIPDHNDVQHIIQTLSEGLVHTNALNFAI